MEPFQKAECSFHCSYSGCPLQIRPARPSGFRVWLEETVSLTENLLKLPEEGRVSGQSGGVIIECFQFFMLKENEKASYSFLMDERCLHNHNQNI